MMSYIATDTCSWVGNRQAQILMTIAVVTWHYHDIESHIRYLTLRRPSPPVFFRRRQYQVRVDFRPVTEAHGPDR